MMYQSARNHVRLANLIGNSDNIRLYLILVLEEAVEAGPRKEPIESSKKLLLLPLAPLTLALLVGCRFVDKGLLKKDTKNCTIN